MSHDLYAWVIASFVIGMSLGMIVGLLISGLAHAAADRRRSDDE